MPGTSGVPATPSAPGTPDAAGARTTVPGGVAPRTDGTPNHDHTSDTFTVSDLSVSGGDLFSRDGRSDDTFTVSDLSSLDEPISRDPTKPDSGDRDPFSDVSSLGDSVDSDPAGRGEPASTAPEPAVAATGPAAAAESARRVADWIDQTPVAPDSRDPWWWCVQATLDAYTTAYGRPGNRAVSDDRILGPDGRLAPTTSWPQLLDILDATPERVTHPDGRPDGVTPQDVLAALRAAPGSMVVVKAAPPNEPQHVFALHSQPQPSGPPTIKVRDGLVPGAEDRPEPPDPTTDPWLRHLFASSTRLAAFDNTGRPTTITSLLPERTTAHPQPTTTTSIDPNAILLASTTPPRGPSQAMQADTTSPEPAGSPWQPSDPAEMDDVPGIGPPSFDPEFQDLNALDLNTPPIPVDWEPWGVEPVGSDLLAGGDSLASDMDGGTPGAADPVDPADPLAGVDSPASESGFDWLTGVDLNNPWDPLEGVAGVDWRTESGPIDLWDPLAGVDSAAAMSDVDRLAEAEQVESDLLAGVNSPTSDMDGTTPGGADPVDPADPLAGVDSPVSESGVDWLADVDPDESLRLLAELDSAIHSGTLPENPGPIGPDPGSSGVPAVGGSGGVPHDWKQTVASAIAQLSAVGTRGEAAGAHNVAAEFVEWTREVLGVDLANYSPKPNDFYKAVVRRFGEQLKDAGVERRTAGLRAWVARQLAADLRRGGESEFREFLPYPEVMSEQRREDLHRQWFNKIANSSNGDYDVAHVVPRIIASRLSLSMRIHRPFGAPYDIGPKPSDGFTPYPVVFYRGVYHLGQLPDPTDTGRADRIAEGFLWAAVSDYEKQRLDRLFHDARVLLRARIAGAENNPNPTNSTHWPILRETFHRQLAVIRERPDSPYHNKARELVEHLRYVRVLLGVGKWESGNRRNLENQFTLHVPVVVLGGGGRDAGKWGLQVRANQQQFEADVGRMAVPGDMVAVHFGEVNGVGTGIAEIPYTAADGTEIYARQEVNLSPGTSVTLSVGKWPEQGQVGEDVAGTIPVVVRAPLVGGDGHVYRLFDTGVDKERFDNLKRHITEALARSPATMPEARRSLPRPRAGQPSNSSRSSLSPAGGHPQGLRRQEPGRTLWTGRPLSARGSKDAAKNWPQVAASAIEQLSAAGNPDEQNFVRWTREVFGIDLTKGGGATSTTQFPAPSGTGWRI
ncbi:hypothetical protein [Micromonospora olivasterospora]|uniref:hypothetical protein n=1 Tax=Micromonospora olivasterospora TaxID=1880 RepID=UPI0011A5E469|nr:hypothetical protein [Micromonospora olivasterospora]